MDDQMPADHAPYRAPRHDDPMVQYRHPKQVTTSVGIAIFVTVFTGMIAIILLIYAILTAMGL